jgi:hypothetical protein
MVLTCRRTGFFSVTYEVSEEQDGVVGQISFSKPYHGQITLGSTSYVADREVRGRWRLGTADGAAVAEAERLNNQPLHLRIDFDAGRWEIVTEPGLRQNSLAIRAGGETVGRVEKLPGLWSNKLRLTAQDGLALEICAFAQWLVGVHWVGIAGTAGAAMAQT